MESAPYVPLSPSQGRLSVATRESPADNNLLLSRLVDARGTQLLRALSLALSTTRASVRSPFKLSRNERISRHFDRQPAFPYRMCANASVVPIVQNIGETSDESLRSLSKHYREPCRCIPRVIMSNEQLRPICTVPSDVISG